MLVGNPCSFEIGTVFYIQHQKLCDFFLRQPFFLVEPMQFFVCLPERLRRVVFIALADYRVIPPSHLTYRATGRMAILTMEALAFIVHWRPCLYHWPVLPIPLGTAHKGPGKQLRPHFQNKRQCFAPAGIAIDIYLCRINGVIVQKIFHQRNCLLCRCLSPVIQRKYNPWYPGSVTYRAIFFLPG